MDFINKKSASLAQPTIVNVVDSQGVRVPSGSTTSDTALTLSGTGDVNAVVLILDLGQIIGSASVKIDGTWVIAVTAPLGEHRYTVKLSNGPESPEWIIHVATAVIPPVIIRVEDSQGNEVPEGEATFDRNVTVTGTALAGGTVEINDGDASWGTAPAPAGNWTKTLNGLAVRGYSLTAKGLYGNEPVSDPWDFTVMAATAPVITGVQDADGDVADGGSTEHQTVTLTGTAARNQRVEIRDNGVSKGVTDVSDVGAWTLPLTGLSFGTHSVSAKGLYDDEPVSEEWRFTVNEALTIDTSPLSLNGMIVNGEMSTRTGQYPPGSTHTRAAKGGLPPYTYTSSNPWVVLVLDHATGKIVSWANGNTIVTATDQRNQKVSYPVTVSNVWIIGYSSGAGRTHPQAVAEAVNKGLSPLTEALFAVIEIMFDQPFTLIPAVSRWNCTAGPCADNGQLYLESEKRLICEYADRPNQWWAAKPMNAGIYEGLMESHHGDFLAPINIEDVQWCGQASLPQTWDVERALPYANPAISNVVDSAGNELENPDTTTDADLTLSGTGTASVVVMIYDSGRPIGSASVTSQGVWQIAIEAALGLHSFTVRSTGEGDSPPWVITVITAAERPVITSVVDSQGVPVSEGGDTFDTRVTLSGTAQAGANIEIDDGEASWGTAPAPGGNWTKTLNGLTVKAYSMTAKDTSDSSQPVSDPWRFNVVPATAPTITRVEDAEGNDIAPDATSFTTSVTLTGTATPGEQVQIFDDKAPLGTVPATGCVWTLSLPSLQYKIYSIKAVGQYGSLPESPVRRFTIAVATAPVIMSVRDSHNVEIPNSGTTTDTQVTIMGTALANEQVQILDGLYPLTTLTAVGGNWTYTLSTTVKAYSIKARGLYGDKPESGVWGFTVQQATPPLVVDTSPLVLSGAMVRFTRIPTHPPAGTVATRTACGGVPPYIYTVNSNAVNIDGNGTVISFRNGQGVVTVKDTAGQQASYSVTVSNVIELDGYNGSNIFSICTQRAAEQGGRIPTLDEWRRLRAAYGGNLGLPGDQADPPAWSSTSAGGKLYYTISPNNGGEATQPDQLIIVGGRGAAMGWAVFVRYA